MDLLSTPVIHRGEIYYADLEPVIGSEQGGVRPVLVLQNDTGNRHSPTVIVAAITGSTGKSRFPIHVTIEDYIRGLHRHSVVLLEQIRTIDRKRLHDFIGILSEQSMRNIDKALSISVGLNGEKSNRGIRQKKTDASKHL